MNKLTKITLAVLGGFEAVYNIFSPLLLCTLAVLLVEVQGVSSTFILILGLVASIFRAIKIGWLKE
jgi:hypothetical protein